MFNFSSALAACLAAMLAFEYANPAGATLVFRDVAVSGAAVSGVVQQVNRVGKSDRLSVQMNGVVRKKETINSPARILVGCDAAFSSLSSNARDNFATRCLS
jgi:hypothetical protein